MSQAVRILLLKHTGSHWLLLTADNHVHFFEFLAHPTSFSQTVENIFHFSFLIKVRFQLIRMSIAYGIQEGRAGVEVFEDQGCLQPYIFLREY